MIIFLYGPDSYRSKIKLDEIIGHYRQTKKSGLNLIRLDAAEISFFDFYQSVAAVSMFAENKLVVLKNVFSSKEFQEQFYDERKSLEASKNVIVIYEPDQPDQRVKLFKALAKECKSQAFSPLSGLAQKKWVQAEFEKRGQKINQDAVDFLIQRSGGDSWRLSNEVEKLSHFKRGATVKKEDVALLVRPRIELDIFKTVEALAARDKARALALLQKHLDEGEQPLYLLSMVAWQVKNLLVVKELAEKGLLYATIAQKSGLHPFVVKKSYFACQPFSLPQLTAAYRRIFQADIGIKTGAIGAETALELLVAGL